jgi:hypothetical protein
MIVREDFTVIAIGILARAFKCYLTSNAALLLDEDGPFLIKFEILTPLNRLIFCCSCNLTFHKKIMCSQEGASALQRTCFEQSATHTEETVAELQRSCLEQGAAHENLSLSCRKVVLNKVPLRRTCPWATEKLSWTKCRSGELVPELQRRCLEQSAAQENLSLSCREAVSNKVPFRRTCPLATEKLSWTKCRTQEKILLGYIEPILNKISKYCNLLIFFFFIILNCFGITCKCPPRWDIGVIDFIALNISNTLTLRCVLT